MKTLIDRLSETTEIHVPRLESYHYPAEEVMCALRTNRNSMGKVVKVLFPLGQENRGLILFEDDATVVKYNGDLEDLNRQLDRLSPLTVLRGREWGTIERSESLEGYIKG